MTEYIDREAAIANKREYNLGGSYDNTELAVPVGAIRSIHAADVRPVVRGKWERMSDNDVFGDIHCKCSACGEDWWQGPGWFRHANYCPNCGAEMEGN